MEETARLHRNRDLRATELLKDRIEEVVVSNGPLALATCLSGSQAPAVRIKRHLTLSRTAKRLPNTVGNHGRRNAHEDGKGISEQASSCKAQSARVHVVRNCREN